MTRTTLLALVMSAALAAPVVAQTSATPSVAPALTDTRWAAFLGCWRGENDPAGTGARVCVSPTADGVSLTTVIANQVVRTETRVANGRPRPVADSGCTGTESVRWSDRGLRLYRTATVGCDGEPARDLSSVSFLLEGPVWVDVETVQGSAREGDVNVRSARLIRAANQKLPDGTAVRSADLARVAEAAALTRWTVEDVIELSGALPPDGVQAAISEAPTPFRLNAKALIAMADSGVNDRVIDLMVGLTYPSRFVVQRAASGGGGGMGMPMGSFMYDPFFAPLVGPAAMFNCYAPFGWAGSAYWSSCAGFNSLIWAGNPYFYSGFVDPWQNGWIATQGSGTTGSSAPQVEGRLVNGRGYTQVVPVDPSAFGGGPGGNYSGSGYSGDSSSSGGGGGVSSSGYSGGGASGDGGGLTAVPRGPGGQ